MICLTLVICNILSILRPIPNPSVFGEASTCTSFLLELSTHCVIITRQRYKQASSEIMTGKRPVVVFVGRVVESASFWWGRCSRREQRDRSVRFTMEGMRFVARTTNVRESCVRIGSGDGDRGRRGRQLIRRKPRSAARSRAGRLACLASGSIIWMAWQRSGT